MPAIFGNQMYDEGLLGFQARGQTIHLCSAQPTNYAGLAAVSLGNAAVSIGDPANGTTGRRVTVAAVTAGEKTLLAETVATHYAIADDTNDILLVSQELEAPITLTPGGTWAMASFDVTFPAPTT